MTSVDVRLQSILMPDDDEFEGAHILFYRAGISRESKYDRILPEYGLWDFEMRDGQRVAIPDEPDPASLREAGSGSQASYDSARRCVAIPAGDLADFSCYLNMCSANKWLELTYAGDITLNLDVQGSGAVHVLVYRTPAFTEDQDVWDYVSVRDAYILERDAYKTKKRDTSERLDSEVIESVAFSSETRTTLSIPLERPDATLLGFVVEGIGGPVAVFGGSWNASADSDALRDVQLCIATTTFKNERYITRNIEAMKRMVAADGDMADHFQMIVVDNGRTLDGPALEDAYVRVFPNINAGGAGGFARGMIESLRLEKRPTHLLIMDDDVLILPESIKRTYTLLSLMRPEYQDHYISGAMLRMEDKTVQHEDIGYVYEYGWFAPKKPAHVLATIYDCAINDTPWFEFKHEYAAWWYCCIPMKFVSESTLPVPVFIRGDDVEFSLRNKAKMISMNGICVWHVGFGNKFSAQMEYYQVIRNSFIFQAFHEHTADIDFVDRVTVLFNELTCSFAYDYADLLLDALEDFMRGPSILEEPNGIDVIKEKGKKNEKLLPYAQVWDEDIDFKTEFRNLRYGKLKTIERKFTTFTRNEQQVVRRPGKGTGFIPYDWGYVFDFVVGRAQLLSVNPRTGEVALRKKDLARFDEVKARYDDLMARYKRDHRQIEEDWRSEYARFTSLEFWNEYLGLE